MLALQMVREQLIIVERRICVLIQQSKNNLGTKSYITDSQRGKTKSANEDL